MESASDKNEVERCLFEWAIADFESVYNAINQNKVNCGRRTRRPLQRQATENGSKIEYYSEKFIRGQFVDKTSIWQVELRRNCTFLSVGLSCLRCFHNGVDEIWTRFDTDIVDSDGKVLHTVNANDHYSKDYSIIVHLFTKSITKLQCTLNIPFRKDISNVTCFTPHDKIGDRREARTGKSSFWETDTIRLDDITQNWNSLVTRGILKLRLRLYIYNKKPGDETHQVMQVEAQDNVLLRYTDNTHLASSNPFLKAVRNLWYTKKGADVTFMVRGVVAQAHKFVLEVQSPVMKKMIERSPSQYITINSMSIEVFLIVLKYLYTQDPDDLKGSPDIETVSQVLEASQLFQIPSLGRLCLTRLITNINVENFALTAKVIFEKVDQDHSFFKSEVTKFYMENSNTLRGSESFKKMANSNKETFLKFCFAPLELKTIIDET